MGLSGGSTTTTQNTNQNVNLPTWVNQGSKDIYNFAKNWSVNNAEYKPFQGDRVADFGSSWDPAKGWITGQIGASNPDIDAARGRIDSVLGTLDPTKTAQDYMNPFLSGVLNPTIRAINENYDKAKGQLAASKTSSGAFGDSSFSLDRALMNRDRANSVGEATGKAYADAFGAGQAQRNQVLQQIMQGAGAQAGLGGQQFNQNMTTANAGAGMGATEQAAQQKGIESRMAEWFKAQGWGGEQATRMAQILAMLPTNKNVTGTTTTTQPDNSGMALIGSILGSII